MLLENSTILNSVNSDITSKNFSNTKLKNPIYFETPRLRKFYEKNLLSIEDNSMSFHQQTLNNLITSPYDNKSSTSEDS